MALMSRRPRRVIRRRIMRKKKILGMRRRRTQPVHVFKRSVYVTKFVTASASVDTPFSLTPSLADVPNFSDFTNLFDQYRISGVKVRLIPRFNVTDSNDIDPPAQVLTAMDYDGNGPTTLAAINQYQSVRITRGTQIHQRYFKPAVLVAAYQSAVSTGYIPKWKQFVDTAATTVPHYGLYGVIPACGSYSWDIEATYYIQCKNVR